MVESLSSGNALKLYLEPPATAILWRILRKGSDTFTGVNDPGALTVYEGDDDVIIDTNSLTNDVRAYYRMYASDDDGETWSDAGGNFGTPMSTYLEASTDVLSFMRSRLEAGLAEEVKRGVLTSSLGYIQVYNATPSLERDHVFPLVTVHLDSESSSDRAIGEDIYGLGDDGDGWLASVSLTIIGWSLNADERSILRQAIRRVILANLPVFAGEGWLMPNLTQEDVDAVSGEYPAHMYQVMSTFSCTAPVRVSSDGTDYTLISDISERLNYGY